MLSGCIITLNTNLVLKIIGVAILTFGFFGSHSVASSWVAKAAIADKAQASSLYLLLYYLGASVLGTLGGKFLKIYAWHGVVLLISISLIVALALAIFLVIKEAAYKMENHSSIDLKWFFK